MHQNQRDLAQTLHKVQFHRVTVSEVEQHLDRDGIDDNHERDLQHAHAPSAQVMRGLVRLRHDGPTVLMRYGAVTKRSRDGRGHERIIT